MADIQGLEQVKETPVAKEAPKPAPKKRPGRKPKAASVPVDPNLPGAVILSVNMSEVDSHDTYWDADGKLIPGQAVSAASLVGEIRRLMKAGYNLTEFTSSGGETMVFVVLYLRQPGETVHKDFSTFRVRIDNASPESQAAFADEYQARLDAGFTPFRTESASYTVFSRTVMASFVKA